MRCFVLVLAHSLSARETGHPILENKKAEANED